MFLRMLVTTFPFGQFRITCEHRILVILCQKIKCNFYVYSAVLLFSGKKKIINECHKNVRCVAVGAKRAISSLFNLSLMEKNQFDFLSFIKNRGLLFASKLIRDISKKQLAQGYWSIAWFHFIHGFISRFPLLINIHLLQLYFSGMNLHILVQR